MKQMWLKRRKSGSVIFQTIESNTVLQWFVKVLQFFFFHHDAMQKLFKVDFLLNERFE